MQGKSNKMKLILLRNQFLKLILKGIALNKKKRLD